MKKREFVLLRYSVFFTLLYILVGCTENRVQMQRLQVIDSLMEAHPQAAYDSLCRFDSLEMGNASRTVVMKQRLLMAKAQNKLYLQLSADTKFQEVVDYYDSWGTDNEKMQAYYLLGCVYRDQKDAPKAMMSYKKAIECADTLRKECDYKVLFGIYGQMADIYRYQYLHKQSIECYKKYSYYAAKANNMASYIQGFELIASEYYALGRSTPSPVVGPTMEATIIDLGKGVNLTQQGRVACATIVALAARGYEVVGVEAFDELGLCANPLDKRPFDGRLLLVAEQAALHEGTRLVA